MDARIAIALCALLLTACPESRGGGGTPMTCGMVQAGGTCAVTDDCRCGMACVASACLRLVNPPMDQQIVANAPTTLMNRLCTKVQNLPCGQSDPDCPLELAEERASAATRMCETEFDRALMCLDRVNLTCDMNGQVQLPMECQDELLASTTGRCEPCRRSTGCSSGPGRPPPPPTDGGVRDGGDDTAPTCFADYAESCPMMDEVEASISCRQEVTASGMIWVCKCDSGLRPDTEFGVRSTAGSCCDFAEIAKSQCGLAP